MPGMVDPMDAFVSFQEVVASGEIICARARIHPDVIVFNDTPEGKPRTTYAFHQGRHVTAFVQFALSPPVEGKMCFQIGYAVDEDYRRRGLAKSLCKKALDELRHGLADDASITEFYLEAMIDKKNLPSLRVADSIFRDPPTETVDHDTDTPAMQYMMFIGSL